MPMSTEPMPTTMRDMPPRNTAMPANENKAPNRMEAPTHKMSDSRR